MVQHRRTDDRNKAFSIPVAQKNAVSSKVTLKSDTKLGQYACSAFLLIHTFTHTHSHNPKYSRWLVSLKYGSRISYCCRVPFISLWIISRIINRYLVKWIMVLFVPCVRCVSSAGNKFIKINNPWIVYFNFIF